MRRSSRRPVIGHSDTYYFGKEGWEFDYQTGRRINL